MATAKEIYDRLKSKGLNDYAVSGIMGNLDKESDLQSNNLQNSFNTSLQMTDAQYTQKVDNGSYTNFVNDKAGYGLAQWTYWSRKEGLLNAAKKLKVSIADAMMQVDYMWEEMQGSSYKKMMEILRNATSVQQASDAFLEHFEAPSNWQSKKAERAAAGQKYYDLYAAKSTSSASKFTPRMTAPPTTDKHWIHNTKGGLNECILISGNSCIPNCVGYAWGRFYEIIGKRPNLSRGNAENWYGYNDGYTRGKTPVLGAIICWAKGKVGVASDGAGHVAVVEQILANGDIVTSNSGYNSTRFYMKTITKASGYGLSGYTFQGFIYPPGSTAVSTPSTPSTTTTTTDNTVDVNYRVKITINNLYIRSAASNKSTSKGFIAPGVYTIVKESDGPGATRWGKLLSGAGWVSLDYCKKL